MRYLLVVVGASGLGLMLATFIEVARIIANAALAGSIVERSMIAPEAWYLALSACGLVFAIDGWVHEIRQSRMMVH